MQVNFSVPGEPVGKGRPRFRCAGQYVWTYTPDRTVSYENMVKLMYKQQCKEYRFPEGIPLRMTVIAYYTIPGSAGKKRRAEMLSGQQRPLKKPDSSNVLKVIEDALNQVAYHDDAQIVNTRIVRYYGEQPRVSVMIQDINKSGRVIRGVRRRK